MRANQPRAVSGLITWTHQGDWSAPHVAGAVMKISWDMEKQGRDDLVVGLGKRLMTESYGDQGLQAVLHTTGALMRGAALNRLGRFDEAWSVIAPALAQFIDSPTCLSQFLTLAADGLAGLEFDKEAAFARSLAVDATDVSGPALAVGTAVLLHRRGDFEDALAAFTWATDRFGLDPASEDLRVAIAGRADSLLKLGRLDECLEACADALETIGDAGDSNIQLLRNELLKSQTLAQVASGASPN